MNMTRDELVMWLRANSSGIYRPSNDAANLIEELEKRDKILTDAMCEIKATIEGRSTQPISDIVAGCQKELCAL